MPFSRISFQHNMSTSTVPEGASSIQCEVYFSRKYKPLQVSPEERIDPVIDALRRCGLIREDDKILLRKAMLVPYGNIIFDLDRTKALRTVHGYLDDLGIAYCGRDGDWGYLRTDTSFISWEYAAQKNIGPDYSMLKTSFDSSSTKKVLCLGAHCDDIEIGCGGTVLKLIRTIKDLDIKWIVFTSEDRREKEALKRANDFLRTVK